MSLNTNMIVHMTWPLDPNSQDANWCYYCMMKCSQYSLPYGSIAWYAYNGQMICYDIVCFSLCVVWQWVLHSCSSCHVTVSHRESYLSTYYVVEYYTVSYSCSWGWGSRCYRSRQRLVCICIFKLGCVLCVCMSYIIIHLQTHTYCDAYK